jgi:MoxR-like ATPase/preprotein translocase subunit YajC
MAWANIIEAGEEVITPHGIGKVRRVSEANETAQVEVGGQLFEVPLEQVSKYDGTPSGDEAGEAKGNGTPYTEGAKIKIGDAVQKVDNPSSKGTVTEVTQRTVRVKWKANGKEAAFAKRDIAKGKHIEKDDGTQDKKKEAEEQRYEEVREQRTPDQKATDTADDLYGLFNLKDKLEQKIETEVDGELRELRDALKQKQVLEVKVGDKVNVVTGLKHKQLEQLINYASLRLSPLLVGMAGTGKTHAGQQTAEALGLAFYSISVGAQTTKTDIMGYMDATGRYIRTLFREAYEFGGVFLMDEIDAGNANVLITINAALANGIAAFPDGMVERHEDFVFIASANTFGNGANRQYVGRNQLDAATLDRFALIEWHIDDDLEENLTMGLNGKAWYMAVRAARDYVAEKNIRALISPRATQKGSKLLDIGTTVDEVIDATLLGSVPDDKKQDVKQIATSIFEKFASEVPNALPTEVDPPSAADLIKEIPF